MLTGYNPNILKYNELWAKYQKGELPKEGTASLKRPLINNQDDAIRCSLLLVKYLEAKAKENNVPVGILKQVFKKRAAIPEGLVGAERLVAGIGAVQELFGESFSEIHAAIEKFELWFDFKTVDDLFLEEESVEKGVFTIE
jgi:hypothetical protein